MLASISSNRLSDGAWVFVARTNSFGALRGFVEKIGDSQFRSNVDRLGSTVEIALDHAAHNPAAPAAKLTSVAARGVADQDAGAETSQHVYGKPKHGRHGRRL
jgi:hypothetical protein